MIDAIVEAKHTGKMEDIHKVLTDHNNGEFNNAKLISYLTERRRQVAAMNVFYDHTIHKNQPQIGEYAKASIPAAMLTSPFVFVLNIGILPDLIEDNYTNYKPDKPSSLKRVENYWYNRDDTVGEIRYNYFFFKTYRASQKNGAFCTCLISQEPRNGFPNRFSSSEN